MRLRKLLLGSAAAVMVAGAASVPAKATDVNGLVVTAANYLESCSSGRGIQFTAWCFLFTGNASASTTFGWNIDYGATPAGNTVEPVATGFEWSGFGLTTSLSLRATRELPNGHTVTVNIPIVGGGSASLAIAQPGGWTATFTATSWTLRLPTSFATFTFRVGEGDTFPDWPDIDVTAAFEFGDVEVTVHAGWGITDEDVNGNAVGDFNNPDADIEVEFGDFTFNALWARVNNGGITNAFGFRAEFDGDIGDVGVNIGAAFSRNDDFEGNYEYDLNPGDRIFSVWGGVSFGMVSLDVTTAWSPDLAQSFHGAVEASYRITPFGSGATITPRAWYEFAQDGGGGWLSAWGLGLTIAVPINQ